MQAQIENVIAYYYTVAQTLKRRIVEMEYEIGEIIPSEKQLAKEFSVSLITI